MNDEKLIGIVLGSGLAGVAQRVEVEKELPFEEVGLPGSTVPGHAGRFLFGKLGTANVALMQGRVHLYEGHSAHEVAAGVEFLHANGVRDLILSNAAGTLNPGFEPGRWMMISDQLNLTGRSPLEGAPEFVDLSEIYDARWRRQFREAAVDSGMVLHEGVYAGLCGPQYETPAEVRMLRTLGADAVGMSTVLEAIRARALEMRVAGFSCLTNWASGMSEGGLDHGEVIETGARAGEVMAELLERVLNQGG